MEAALQEFLDYLCRHGIDPAVSERLHRCADHNAPLSVGAGGRHVFELPGHEPVIEYRDPDAVLAADHATQGVALALLRGGCIRPGDRFWDVGCGTGVLAVVGARLGGTDIVATDVSEAALALARRTLDEAGVEARFHLGSLLDGIPAEAEADVIVANLPHKPVPPGVYLTPSQNGGEEGDSVHGEFRTQALRHLAPGGRVYFFMHSLPHPRLLDGYRKDFRLTLLAWRRRYLLPGEYGALQDHFVERARRGISYIGEQDGRRHLVAGVWEAALR